MESHYLLILCWLPWTQMMKAEVRMIAIENLERSTYKARPFLEGHQVMPSLSQNRRDFWSSQPLKTLTMPVQLKRMEDVPIDWRSLKTAGQLEPCVQRGAPPLLTLRWKSPTGTSRGHFGWFWPSLCPAAESCVGSMRLHWRRCTRFPVFLSSPYILRDKTGSRLTSCSQLTRSMAKSQTKKEGILQRPGEGR